REAQSAAGLNHPNIVSVYDWGEANGTYFIVMEYVEGESLAELIQSEGRLHPDRAAEIAADMASALGFAHRNGGVIHRDVKPGNVLLTRDGTVKVADFGIARAIADSSDQNLTKTGSVMGTATYFSPEQARGASVDPRSDVYSLGCVLYEMIIGRPPFAGENAVAIAYKHVQEAPVAPRRIDPALPETLEAIILKCLAKNPANRYPSAQDMRADLRRYLEGARIMAEPVLAPPVDPGATGLMSPTGYMQPTGTPNPTGRWDDDGYNSGGHQYDEGYDDYDDEEPPRSKAFLVVLVLLLLVLAGLLFLVARALGGGDNDPPAVQVTVPKVVDLLQPEAEAAITAAKLEPKIDQAPNAKPAGTVVAQDPAADEEVDEGSQVTLTVSTGPATVNVPDIQGKSQDDATKLLSDAGFVPSAKQVENADVEEGMVIGDSRPPHGTPLATGETVEFDVSAGSSTVAVPDVTNQPADQAQSALQGAGFTVNRTEAPSDSVAAGNVISTDPAAGAQAAAGSAINMVVSTGQSMATIPNVQGLSEDNARRQLEQAGFRVTSSDQPTDRQRDDGQVLSQAPAGGSQAPVGGEVNIVIGRFQEPDTTLPSIPPFPGGDG
ncbi:MAG TPA: Stk1 family PASTA domain-containing Ser/Thr kinase, partial [Acidimicrobiales bacterium]|nr:Stk1 family PASTA domain-containing Ser/Thr kinase [Acidimicrobiales bacterium]